MNIGRFSHTASVLPNGKVLVTGGYDAFSAMNSTELYDPSTGTWQMTSHMNYARGSHSASVLKNGNVFVAGGLDSIGLNTSELYESSQINQ
ncbi:unnamed protein product [Rotaria sp. Silwood1]|nr:unnamed protein product [Rotaria sp. Silwood1]